MRGQEKRLDMSTTTENTIIDQLTAAVAARKDSLVQLRGRIEKLIAPLPVGVVLADDAGEIGKIRRVCTGASQWGNQTWNVTIKGKGLIADRKLVSETCERSYWDGNNMHHHSTEPFCLYTGSEMDMYDSEELNWLSGRDTRALALRLPRAIERYIEECKAEEVANKTTAV